MLLLTERQTRGTWEHSEKQRSVGNREPLDGKLHSLFFLSLQKVYSLVTARLRVPNVSDMRDKTCVRQAGRYDLLSYGCSLPILCSEYAIKDMLPK